MDWWQRDAVDQAAGVARREVGATELVEQAIDRVEALNPVLNAVIHRTYDDARQAAAAIATGAPFAGVPMLLKDALCQTKGRPYHFGSALLRDLNHVSDHDSYLADSLRRAGFAFLGRTNTPEFASAFTTEPRAYGATKNPWDLEYSPGGSSGGSAAAVSAGLVPMAHGNDMGGSLRVPASCCGVVGLKPSRGRISLGPAHGEYWGGLAHEGFLTRSVRDAAAVLDLVKGYHPGDPRTPGHERSYVQALVASPRLRIGVRTLVPGTGLEPDPECLQATRLTADLLADLGHDVRDVSAGALDGPELYDGMRVLFCSGIADEVDRLGARLGRKFTERDVEPRNWEAIEFARSLSALDYVAAINTLDRYSRRVLEDQAAMWDLLLTPTMGEPPPRRGTYRPDESLSRLGAYTRPFNVTGQPAISLPVHVTGAGLPVGVQLVGAHGRDDLVLGTAAELEGAVGWTTRFPPLALAASP